MGNFILIVISNNLKVVFKIDKIIFNFNNILVYSYLYNQKLNNELINDNLVEFNYIKFDSNLVEEKKIKIINFKKNLIDSEITYNYIINKKINNDNNSTLNKFILNSIKYSIKIIFYYYKIYTKNFF